MKLKQLFCRHVFITMVTEKARTTREVLSEATRETPTVYANFQYYAERQKCVKCNKTRIVERRFILD